MSDLKIISESTGADNGNTLHAETPKVTPEEVSAMVERMKPLTQTIRSKYEAELAEYCRAEPGNFEIIVFFLKKSPYFIKAIYQLYQLFGGFKVNEDKKTTMLATVKVVLGIIALILGLFGRSLPAEISDAIIGLAGSGYLLFSWLQGLFTNKKTAK